MAMKDLLQRPGDRFYCVLMGGLLVTHAVIIIISWILYSHKTVLLVFPLVSTLTFMASLAFLFSIFLIHHMNNSTSNFHVEEANIQRIAQPYLKISHEDLLRATSNFNDAKIIGRGRFGTVYRGILLNGHSVAVKRMKLEDPSSLNHFLSELEILGRLRHRNLLRILGYFFNNEEMIIVSKFMPNLSLDVLLHGPLDCRLDWKQRIKIAVGVAHGLAYLHHECGNTIVHCDLKPGNILVDEYLEAHIADFGVAKIVNDDQIIESSLGPWFTVGYTAPERAYQVRSSPKADVFSYGIVLLELISGVKPTSSTLVNEDLTLPQWAQKALADNNLTALIDHCLKCDCEDDQFYDDIERVIKMGIICTHQKPEMRPDMKDVVKGLVEIQQGIRQFNISIPTLVEESHMSPIARDTSTSSGLYSIGYSF